MKRQEHAKGIVNNNSSFRDNLHGYALLSFKFSNERVYRLLDGLTGA
jgi:hypothetical protein